MSLHCNTCKLRNFQDSGYEYYEFVECRLIQLEKYLSKTNILLI